jgi:uncharacterized protein (TIGR00369 family)
MASNRELVEQLNVAFGEWVPHNRALGLTVLEVEGLTLTVGLPWNDQLIGDPETGVIHGGAITTLLDTCCGGSVYLRLKDPQPVATLDLRVDFLGRAPTKRDLKASAECHHVTSSVAFVRGWAWCDDPTKPFAIATATFALSTQGRPVTLDEVLKSATP